jgi:hypothetical protein
MFKLALFSIAKKVTVLLVAKVGLKPSCQYFQVHFCPSFLTLVCSLQKYGFHRLYRRMMEINKRFIPVDKQAKARELAQVGF